MVGINNILDLMKTMIVKKIDKDKLKPQELISTSPTK